MGGTNSKTGKRADGMHADGVCFLAKAGEGRRGAMLVIQAMSTLKALPILLLLPFMVVINGRL